MEVSSETLRMRDEETRRVAALSLSDEGGAAEESAHGVYSLSML